ncbi:MAG: DinB family protein [Bacteroidota bacterium]
METQKQLIIKLVLDAWNSRIESANKKFESLTEEDLQKEVSPGRNRGIYLLGHLAIVHDKMLPLLNFEVQLYPHLDDAFLTTPDRFVSDIPSAKELRIIWNTVNSKLAAHFNQLSPDEWFQKHSAVSAEDFLKEPHRNRLNVVIGRTNHLQYHMGQVALIK